MPEESDYEQLLENSCSLLTDLLLDSHHPTVPDDKLLTMVYAKVGWNYITPFDDQYILYVTVTFYFQIESIEAAKQFLHALLTNYSVYVITHQVFYDVWANW